MILIDLQKAFDTVDQILLKKVKYIGFLPETVRWFESYLKNRNLTVSLEKNLLEPGDLNRVPQGSKSSTEKHLNVDFNSLCE